MKVFAQEEQPQNRAFGTSGGKRGPEALGDKSQ